MINVVVLPEGLGKGSFPRKKNPKASFFLKTVPEYVH
jgi:hypothetical protein